MLRIEDTDIERSDKKYEKDIFEGLKWLGIEPDESPEAGGPYAPYRQSERTETYKKWCTKLLNEGKAFYCFHSEKELGEEKEKLLEAKRPSLHLCEYRTLDPEEGRAFTETKEDYIIRFKTPAGRKISFPDLIRGEVNFESDLLGDFSIAKRLEVPLYNFAVVVDDEEMAISHVIRGEDHISNTPKQLLLIEALGFPRPEYAHLPLILGPDRSKLSKRHGATSVGEYREQGYLSEALFNFMTLLGWNPGDKKEIFSEEELIKEFSLEKAQKSGAVFDIAKLDWMNSEYIRKLTPEELLKYADPFLPKNKKPRSYIIKVLTLEQPRLKKLSEIGEKTEYFFRQPEYNKELLRWKNMNDEEIAISLDKSIDIISNINVVTNKRSRNSCNISKEELEKIFLKELVGDDKGKILWPLRAALTGKKASPGPFEIMEILGVEESIKRLKSAKLKLRGETS